MSQAHGNSLPILTRSAIIDSKPRETSDFGFVSFFFFEGRLVPGPAPYFVLKIGPARGSAKGFAIRFKSSEEL